MAHTETRARSIVKTISWRIVSIIITFAVILAVTDVFRVSLESTSIAAVLSTIAYYIHERVWNSLPWGRHTGTQ